MSLIFLKKESIRRVPSCSPPYVGTFPYGRGFAYIELCADVGNLVGNSSERWILGISVVMYLINASKQDNLANIKHNTAKSSK